jgi:hypothetical protein
MKPQTECFCQDVADTICSKVAPPARSSSASTVAIRVPSRCLGAGAPSVLVASLVAFGLAGALGMWNRGPMLVCHSLSTRVTSGVAGSTLWAFPVNSRVRITFATWAYRKVSGLRRSHFPVRELWCSYSCDAVATL